VGAPVLSGDRLAAVNPRIILAVVVSALLIATACGSSGPSQTKQSQKCVGWQNLLSVDQSNGEKPSVIQHDQEQVDTYC
jgi:hypothetical protein